MDISPSAVFLNRAGVSSYGSPPLDLPFIFLRHAATQKVTTEPLKPASGIVSVDPTLFHPYRERQARIHPKVIEARFMVGRAKLCSLEPIVRKLVRTIRHVFSAKHSQTKQLFWRQLWSELRIKISTDRFNEFIPVIFLHPVVYGDDLRPHASSTNGETHA